MSEPAVMPLSRRLLFQQAPSGRLGWRRILACVGPGFLIAVGYMDPGNWATDIAGGSAYGYGLLWVVMLANLIAMVLQHLSLKLGIVTGTDLARCCRDRYAPPVVWTLWVFSELAMIATDLAEIIGTAIALQLLFGLPLPWGVAATIVEVLLLLSLRRMGMTYIERMVMALMALVALCFLVEMVIAHPRITGIAHGFIPHVSMVHDSVWLLLAMGILGATVMPHNLYLHSALVRDMAASDGETGTSGREAGASAGEARELLVRRFIHRAGWGSATALSLALVINLSILILAAAAFYVHGQRSIASMEQAHAMLNPLLGSRVAGVIFACGLLACGFNSVLTGTLAGQVVLEGFLNLRMTAPARRLLTRSLALIPAGAMVLIGGEAALNHLLILSQVVLAVQLPCAAIPLLLLTGDRSVMGVHANHPVTQVVVWVICLMLCGLSLVMGASLFR